MASDWPDSSFCAQPMEDKPELTGHLLEGQTVVKIDNRIEEKERLLPRSSNARRRRNIEPVTAPAAKHQSM